MRRNDTAVYHAYWPHKGGEACGDYHFVMARPLAEGFQRMYHTAASTNACSVGCLCCTCCAPCDKLDCGSAGYGVPEQGCWKGVFIEHHMGARNGFTEDRRGRWEHDRDERPYRSLGDPAHCSFAASLGQLRAIGFNRLHYELLRIAWGQSCAWFRNLANKFD